MWNEHPNSNRLFQIVSYDFPIFHSRSILLFALRMAIFDDVLRSVHVVSVSVWRLAHELSRQFLAACGGALLLSAAGGRSADSAAIPEMARLAQALAGKWNTSEILQHGEPRPRRRRPARTAHVKLTGGGTTLVSEGHSVGTVGGDLRWFTHDLVGPKREELSVSHLLPNAN